MNIRLLSSMAFAILACGCFGVRPVHGQLAVAVQRFDEAAQHYAAGNYREAVLAYEAVLAAGHVSGAAYYNTGNAYFRLDAYGQALRYWEKARRLLGDDPALLHNIDIVQARIGTPFSSVPPPFWVNWWHRVVLPPGARLYLVLGLLCYLAAAALFSVRIWTQSRSAWQRRARAASLAMAVALLVAAFGVSADEARSAQGVVITGSARLTDTQGGPETVEVPEGVMVSLLSREGPHYQVRLPNGVTGYLPEDTVGEV